MHLSLSLYVSLSLSLSLSLSHTHTHTHTYTFALSLLPTLPLILSASFSLSVSLSRFSLSLPCYKQGLQTEVEEVAVANERVRHEKRELQRELGVEEEEMQVLQQKMSLALVWASA